MVSLNQDAARKSVPRVCGDDPGGKPYIEDAEAVFPAYAGMIPCA